MVRAAVLRQLALARRDNGDAQALLARRRLAASGVDITFDTFLAATEKLSTYKRWKFRALVMLHISYTFLRGRVRAMREFLRQDGIENPILDTPFAHD